MGRPIIAALALAVVAAVSTAVWRMEVLAYPQGIREIIEYTHWAVPFGITLFAAWLAVFAPVPHRARRPVLMAATAAGMALWYPLAKVSIISHFAGVEYAMDALPESFVNSVISPILAFAHVPMHGIGLICSFHLYLLIPLTPAFLAGLLWFFGVRPSLGRLAAAVLVYVAAWPLSMMVLDWLPGHYDHDLIEAFRVGTVIPFLIIGLGVLGLPGGQRSTIPSP